LSEVDCLLTSSPIASYYSENIAQLIAASVTARGVLFGNARHAIKVFIRPSVLLYMTELRDFSLFLLRFVLSRWHAIRRPKLWQIEQSFRSNKVNSIADNMYVLHKYLNDVRKVCMLILTHFLISY